MIEWLQNLSDLKINQAANDELRTIEKQAQQERTAQQKDTADALIQHKAALTAGAGNADATNFEPGPDNEDPATSVEYAITVLQPLEDRMGTQKDALHRQLKTKREQLASLSAELGGINALLPQQESSLSSLKTRMKAHAEIERELQEVVDKLRQCYADGSEKGAWTVDEIEIPDGPIDLVMEAAEKMEMELTECAFEYENGQRMVKKIKREQMKNSACPCCKQQVSTEQQRQAFETGISEFFKIGKIEEKKGKISSLHDSVKAEISKLKKILGKHGSDVDKLRQDHDSCENQVAELKARKEGMEKEHKDLQKDVNDREAAVLAAEKAATAIEEQMARWRSIKHKVDDLGSKRRKQSQSAASSSNADGRNIGEIEDAQKERQDRKDDLISKKDKAANEESSLLRKMNVLKLTTLEKQTELQEAQTKGGRYKEVDDAIREQKKRCSEIEIEKVALRERLEKARKDLTDVERQLQSAKSRLQSREEDFTSQHSAIQSDREALQRETDALEKMIKAAEQKDVDSVQRELTTKQDLIDRKTDQIRTKTPQMTALNAQISSEDRTRRTIIENL